MIQTKHTKNQDRNGFEVTRYIPTPNTELNDFLFEMQYELALESGEVQYD